VPPVPIRGGISARRVRPMLPAGPRAVRHLVARLQNQERRSAPHLLPAQTVMRVSFIITVRDEPPEILNATLRRLDAPRAPRVHRGGRWRPRVRVDIRPGRYSAAQRAAPRGISLAPDWRGCGHRTVLVWLDAHMSFADDCIIALSQTSSAHQQWLISRP
jgi:hypothetical protein